MQHNWGIRNSLLADVIPLPVTTSLYKSTMLNKIYRNKENNKAMLKQWRFNPKKNNKKNLDKKKNEGRLGAIMKQKQNTVERRIKWHYIQWSNK